MMCMRPNLSMILTSCFSASGLNLALNRLGVGQQATHEILYWLGSANSALATGSFQEKRSISQIFTPSSQYSTFQASS